MEIENPRLRNLLAWAAMLAIGFTWGGTIPLTKVAVSTGYQPLGLIFWQLVIGVVVLGAYLAVRGWRPKISRAYLFYCLVIAIIGTIIPNGFSYIASAQLPAGVMSIVIATVPMFGLVLALGLCIEKVDVKRIAGVVTGFTAMVLIAAPETSLPDPEKAIFVLVALAAPLCYGAESNFIAVRTPKGTDAVSTLFMASVIGVFLTAPSAFAFDQFIDPTKDWSAPEYALIAASVIHAFTYCGYIWLVGFGGPVFSVQVAYPVTISGVFFSILFLDEDYSGWIWASLVLVIAGLALVQPKPGELEGKAARV